MKKIGIMGGTFNPIHIGHLILAEWAMEAQELDEVWFIPTGHSYMKDSAVIVSPKERYEMTCCAIAGKQGMKCLDMEVKREGYTYTYETMEELKRSYPDNHFYFIMGADCLLSIENWKNVEKIFENTSVIAAERGDSDKDKMEAQIQFLQQKYHADIHLMSFLQLEISSTIIRERIASGYSVEYLVPEPVISYIEEKGLYGYENK